MKTVTAYLENAEGSPYSQSRPKPSEKREDESHAQYEERTWREKMHVSDDGWVVIPQMAFKNGLSEIAKFKGQKIVGKRNATYTKHFESGVSVFSPLVTGVKAADVRPESVYVPSDGRRGGGSRVWKIFPLIPKWSGNVTFHVLDPELEKTAPTPQNKVSIFEQHVVDMGIFIGVGRFRPRNNGYYGRFMVKKFVWADE